MGAQIIEAITSGLGLIEPIAQEFLNGFTTLVWATPTGGTAGLTPVAMFCFVMLGVSISFAVVKLVLNLIRGNTGA